MKVLSFEASFKEIVNGKLELADIIKSCLWQHAPQWFEILDFEDDTIYLEPNLSFYFRKLAKGEKAVTSLEQLLCGYAPKESMKSTFSVFTDPDGVIYLPNIGYIQTKEQRRTEKTITLNKDNESIIIDGEEVFIKPIKLIKDNQFSLLNYKPSIYTDLGDGSINFSESINDSINSSEGKLVSALIKLEKNIPSFYDAIHATTREFGVFNSTNSESFTALHYFGTAFLNLAQEKRKEIFFLDDISHQCGHTIYYTLTHDFQKFLKPHRDFPLKDFSNVSYEERGVYGAFHGLFTYTTILNSLHIALKEKLFNGEEEEEALARLGFYYGSFERDLCAMGDDRILTEEGWQYYDMFQSSFNQIRKEYYHIVKYFEYSNQNYNFKFNKFQEINQFKIC